MTKQQYTIMGFFALIPFIFGFILGAIYFTSNPSLADYKLKIVEEQVTKLVENNNKIIEKHNLYDIDGSDEMTFVLEASDSLSIIYNIK